MSKYNPNAVNLTVKEEEKSPIEEIFRICGEDKVQTEEANDGIHVDAFGVKSVGIWIRTEKSE